MDEHKYINILRIKAIYEKNGITPKKSHQHRIDSWGYIENLNRNTPLYFNYLDGHGILKTSNVQSFEENNHELKVETKSSIYIFENVRR